MNGKEFPNSWEEIQAADDDQFETCTFDEFMAGMGMWQLPSSHSFLMRIYNTRTNKVKEHVYKREDMARKRLMKECLDLTMRSFYATTFLSTLLNKLMSLITIEQFFDEFAQDCPEMVQCYDFMYTDEEELIGDTCAD